MENTGVTSNVGGTFFSRHRTFLVLALVLVLAVAGYFWWRSGFTLEFSKFFAAGGCAQENFSTPVWGNGVTVRNIGDSQCTLYLAAYNVNCPSGRCPAPYEGWNWREDQTLFRVNSKPISPNETVTISVNSNDRCEQQIDLLTEDPGPIGSHPIAMSPGSNFIGFRLGGEPNRWCNLRYRLKCVSNSCQIDDNGGPDLDGCMAEGDACNVVEQHLACVNNACALVAGGGGNQDGCTTAGQACGVVQTKNAVCVGHTIPTNMTPGQVVPVTVTLRNTGTVAWTQETPANYDLTLYPWPPSSPAVSPQAMNLPVASVPANGTATFSFNLTAPTAPGTYNAQYRIVEQGVGWIGATCGASIVIPTPTPSTAPDLSCEAASDQATVGQSVQFSAKGGTGTYAWFAPGGLSTARAGNPFPVTYSTPGTKTVTVTSGPNQASCVVNIVEPVARQLICSPARTTATSGQSVAFTASGGSQTCDGRNTYQWSTNPAGVPPTGQGCSFSSVFTNTTQPTQNFVATVRDGASTASCEVAVSCPAPSCATPPTGCSYQGRTACACGELVCPSNAPLVCAPVTQTVAVGQTVRVTAGGGTSRTFSWTASGGTPASGTGPNAYFDTSYPTAGSYTVLVSAGGQSASCNVVVQSTGTSPNLAITKLVRNVTQSSAEADSVTANASDTVEFSLRVSSSGSGTATSVTVRDALPAGLTYVPGSTTIDAVPASDGIVSTGLSLGDMPSGRTITVRFRATVATSSFFGYGTSTLINTGYARGTNVTEVSDVAFVTVVNTPPSVSISLTKMGRNTSRGETSEHSPVHTSPAQTIEFVLRVRNTSSAILSNVMLRDVLPAEVTLVAGSVRIGGAIAPDTLTTTGLSLGTLSVGQEVVVRFSGLVAPATQLPSGTTTVLNTATVTADGTPSITAQLPIIITNGGVVVPPVSTGPGETTVLALIISAIVTLLYVGYTSTETYRRHEAGAIAKDSRGNMSDFSK